MTTPASNNRFKGVTFQDQATPATPAAGDGRLFLDTADGLLKWIDDAGTVTEVALGSGAGFADPMTTRGDIIVRNASNVTARLAKGAADTFLQSDGTDVGYAAVTDAMLSTSDITTNNASTTKHGFAPKYPNDATKYLDGTGAYTVPAGAAAGITLIEQHTASTSASLDFPTCFSSTYDSYLIDFVGILTATDNVIPLMRVTTNSGSSYDSGNNYNWAHTNIIVSGTTGSNNAAAANAFKLFTDSSSSAGVDNSGPYYMKLHIMQPTGSTYAKRVWGTGMFIYNTGPNVYGINFFGTYTQTTALTGFQVLMASGNITSGTVRVYGYAK